MSAEWFMCVFGSVSVSVGHIARAAFMHQPSEFVYVCACV